MTRYIKVERCSECARSPKCDCMVGWDTTPKGMNFLMTESMEIKMPAALYRFSYCPMCGRKL